MNPRPIYRWKSFWLGVVVLVFLGWGWARSISRIDSVSYGDGVSKKAWSVSSSGGAMGYIQIDLSKAEFHDFSAGPGGWEVGSGEMQSKGPWFPAAVRMRRAAGFIPSMTVEVAYWLVVLVFVILWGSLLVRRRWRMRQVTAMLMS